jgi:hypothetical protein
MTETSGQPTGNDVAAEFARTISEDVRTVTGHALHLSTNLLSLDGVPRCEIPRECPEHGVQQCPGRAEWGLMQPCARCGRPVSILMCTECKDILLRRRTISVASVRTL